MDTQKTQIEITIPWYLLGILALGVVLAAGIGSWTLLTARATSDVLSTTGSAKTRVMSDRVKWSLNIVETVTQSGMQGGYSSLAADLEATRAFLVQNGIADADITVSQVFVEEIYKYGPEQTGPREFNLRQTVIVQSNEVAKIDSLSKNLAGLASKGVFVAQNWLEYYVSTLPELRVSLLGDALKDAKARADAIATASGNKVGTLREASSGVVQVLAPNSVEIADYGSYDTQSIEKEVMVTVRASFSVR